MEGKHVSLQQVVFWDETHKKIRIGKGSKSVKSEVRFPRDKEGKVDIQNGTYAERSTYLQVKYPEEVRLSLGVAQVKSGNKIVGKRAAPYDYSGRVLLSITDYELQIKK